jgi:hypothetical protein
MYRDTRNAMVMLYKEDTSRRLTFTAVRQALGGDVNGLLRWAGLAGQYSPPM